MWESLLLQYKDDPVRFACVGFVIVYFAVQIYTHFRFISYVKPSYPINDTVTFRTKDKGPITLQTFINEQVPEFREGNWSIFNPFLWNKHFQTMFAGIRQFRFCDKVYFTRNLFEVSDGGTVALDRVVPYDQYRKYRTQPPVGQPEKIDSFTRYMSNDELENLNRGGDDSKPIFLILPGLSGSSGESYIRSLYYQLGKHGLFDCFVLNARGCGNVNITTPTLFCGLWTKDVREVINFFSEKYPNRKIYCMGVSMGSIILNNYLCQEGEKSKVTLAILVASVWDLVTSSMALETNLISQLFYSTVMAYPLLSLLFRHKDKLMEDPLFQTLYTPDNKNKVKRLKLFDDYFTSKMFGFTCASHYYSMASPLNRIGKLRTPILNISALDDPITNGLESHVMDRAKHQPFVNMVNLTLGGHVGFFKWNNERWYAKPLTKFIEKFHTQLGGQEGFKMEYDEAFLPTHPLTEDDLLEINQSS